MRALLVVSILMSASIVLAQDHRIPIAGPTVINRSGSYVVVRDIGTTVSNAGPPAITIAADNVEIDLNGHVLRLGEPVVAASDVTGVTIYGGTLEGYEEALRFSNVNHFSIRYMQVHSYEDGAIHLDGTFGVVERCMIDDQGNGGIIASGESLEITQNTIAGGRGFGILAECQSCRISGNTIKDTSWIGISVSGSNNLVRDNLVAECGYDGIEILGSANQVEGNMSNSNGGYGLRIRGDGNVYRGNTARYNAGVDCSDGSAGDLCDSGVDNLSHGDNYVPGPR